MKQKLDIRHCPCCDRALATLKSDLYCNYCDTLITPWIDSEIYGPQYFKTYMGYRQSELNAKIQDIRWNLVTTYHAIGGRLLDFGCSVGAFIEEASKHDGRLTPYVAEGYDINPVCLEYCETKGLTVHRQLPQKYKYDVVTMFDVLEHIPNLEEIIRTVGSMLTTNGVWIVATPNFYADRLETIDRWTHYKPQEHVCYLSEASIRSLCHKFDFDLLAINFEESQYRPPKDNIATYVMRKLWKSGR